MARSHHHSASPYEATIGFCRALRVGDRICVSGTAPIGPNGHTAAPGDAFGQTWRCLQVVEEALEALGGHLTDVVRTRVYIVDRADHEAVGRAHGQVFGKIRPTSTMVIVAGLLDPEWRVEIEAEAIVAGEAG